MELQQERKTREKLEDIKQKAESDISKSRDKLAHDADILRDKAVHGDDGVDLSLAKKSKPEV